MIAKWLGSQRGLVLAVVLGCAWSVNAAEGDRDRGLVAHWNFDEGSGAVAHDGSGHGHDGSIYGATWTDGACAQALDFDGVDDYVDVVPFPQFGSTQPFSLCAWIRRTSVGGEEPYILNNMDSSHAGIGLSSDGDTTFVTVGGADGGPGQATAWDYENIADGKWHFIVGTYDGSALVLYVDGEWRAANSSFSSYTGSDWNMNIGRMEQGARYYFDGSIDEARIYDRALSESEILEIYDLCHPPRLGDMNCDGALNFDDIPPFVLVLGSCHDYLEAYPDCDCDLADCNQDGYIDFDDINPFVALLSGGG
jgi:hypothetical protein